MDFLDGEGMREIRGELELTGEGLAKRLGFSHGAASHWETGRRPIPPIIQHILVCPRCQEHFLEGDHVLLETLTREVMDE